MLLAVVSTACTSGSPASRPSPSASSAVPTGTPVACTGFRPGAELLVVGGADAFNAGLYGFTPCTGEVTTAGPGTRYSTVDAAGGRVVVAQAQAGADAVAFVRGARLEPLAGAGMPFGLTPAVSGDGRVAYVALDADKERPFALHVWSGSRSRVVHRSADALAPLSWGPDGLLAVGRRKAGPTQAIGNATVTVLRVPVAGTATVEWEHALPFDLERLELSHDGSRVAVSGPGRALVLGDRGKSATDLPAGWTVYAWSDDDTMVLVARASEIALARPGSTVVVDRTTFPPGGVHGLAWLRS